MARGHSDPVTRYARAVVDGDIIACKWVRLACERHLTDLENAHERGLHFDPEAAQFAIDFFQFLKHSKGEWAGQSFELELWQQFIVGSLFGWLREDGTRRFRTAYIEVPRKNGKSTLLSGIGLLLFAADGEPGAEVYTAATKRDQARITHGEATRMVKASPALRKRIRVYKDNLHIEATASKFEPLGADADSMDGLNVHGAIIDELHAHKTRKLWDVLDTATGSRRQPLIVGITTAGYDRQTICWELHEYCQRILEGIISDDTYFAYIATIDEGDDWTDSAVWAKANPNYGVSVKVDDLERLCEKAKQLPTAQNAFLRLRLNVWTQQDERWMGLDKWEACPNVLDIELLRNRRCWGGLDLSSVSDITALVLVFEPEDGIYPVLPMFWVPEDRVLERAQKDRVPYDVWVREGYITATPGDVVDYNWIKSDILQAAHRYELVDIAYDRWNSSQLVIDLQDEGLTMFPMGQGFASMNAPVKQLEQLILSRKINHGGNPVLKWMFDNVQAKMDPAGNVKFDKQRSREKIDGMVALVMAVDRMMRHEGDDNQSSIYEERGIRLL